jgi:preprotein translocase SecF subunit
VEQAVGRDIEVKTVLEYPGTGFRLSYKEEGAEGEGDAAEDDAFSTELRDALAGVLRKGPADVQVGEGGAATVRLYFEEDHDPADIAARLEAAGLSEVQVTPAGEEGVFDATAQADSGTTAIALRSSIPTSFREARVDSKNVAYVLKDPIPELNTIGKQVVGELRDKAILAILVSLFVIVMYIRVRFAEYSYGFAAVAALLHDVLVTLGVMTLAMTFTGLAVEMSLPMIAAFLTIIGYSLNDTIIIFDRVRENLPRHKGTLKEVINLSINQTLSRTIMTSGTTLVAVGLIFAFNVGSGNVLEGFSLAMMCGIVVGTYSTIFIASPVFLFLENRVLAARAREEQEERAVTRGPAKRTEAVV